MANKESKPLTPDEQRVVKEMTDSLMLTFERISRDHQERAGKNNNFNPLVYAWGAVEIFGEIVGRLLTLSCPPDRREIALDDILNEAKKKTMKNVEGMLAYMKRQKEGR